jgi:phosphoribosyl 1,2-cyclic phosphodiesterase
MRFAALGSGSRGNAWIVEAGRTRVLFDCGFGPRECRDRLARLEVAADSLSALVVSHEHSDHVAGVFALARRHALPVFLTRGTLAACALPDGIAPVRAEAIAGDAPFVIGELEITPFPVPHDAREPVQFVCSDGRYRLGMLTDAGMPTPHIARTLNGCDALVLECNHDSELLWQGRYPPPLKARIAGSYGHLGNDAAQALLASIDRGRLQHVVAAHLSEENNRPDLARNALAVALGCCSDWIGVADQEAGIGWRALL